MVDTVDSVSAAMDDITSCDAVTVGCGGFEVLKTGRVSVVQVGCCHDPDNAAWCNMQCTFLSCTQHTPETEVLDFVSQVLAANICYLFDMLITDPVAKDAVDGALKELLEDQGIMKITHDSGHLMAALQFQLSAGLHTVFDTQVNWQVIQFAVGAMRA